VWDGVLAILIHVSIRLLPSALDVTGGFDNVLNPMSVRVIFCLPFAKNCIENGIRGFHFTFKISLSKFIIAQPYGTRRAGWV